MYKRLVQSLAYPLDEYRPSGVDPAFASWMTRLTAAGSSVTAANQVAVKTLIAGLRADGNYSKLGHFGLFAGVDNLAGSLIPIIGSDLVNNAFTATEFSRTTGLLGGGGRYLISSYNNNADPQDDNSCGFWISTGGVDAITGIGVGAEMQRQVYDGYPGTGQMWLSSSSTQAASGNIGVNTTGFCGISRTLNYQFQFLRNGEAEYAIGAPSGAPTSGAFTIFGRGGAGYNGRLALYFYGRAVNLAQMKSRFDTYMANLT